MRGDCLTCARLGPCTETNKKRVLESYTCPLYQPVFEGIYQARIELIRQYGEDVAVDAMLNRPQESDDEK